VIFFGLPSNGLIEELTRKGGACMWRAIACSVLAGVSFAFLIVGYVIVREILRDFFKRL